MKKLWVEIVPVIPAALYQTADPGPAFIEVDTVIGWSSYGLEAGMSVEQIRIELKRLFDAGTWAGFTTDEKERLARWFVVDKDKRDTVYTAIQQQKQAGRMARRYLRQQKNNDQDSLQDSIKDSAAQTVTDLLNTPGLSYGEMYINSDFADTIITTQDVPVKMAGVTTAGEISSDFGHSDNRLTYNGVKTKKFMVDFELSVIRPGATNFHAIFYAAINDAIEQKTGVRVRVDSNLRELSGFAIVELNESDYLEIWVENKTNSEDIDGRWFKCRLVEIKT